MSLINIATRQVLVEKSPFWIKINKYLKTKYEYEKNFWHLNYWYNSYNDGVFYVRQCNESDLKNEKEDYIGIHRLNSSELYIVTVNKDSFINNFFSNHMIPKFACEKITIPQFQYD